ncbi:MAG: SMP-30/gluconolactonase/LRE family protein [Streptosporangiaceae bacterium]|nr:SMP-30/gluconolactonase/LRE family protein [Streptosporangiaceae bacterium]
MSSLLAPNASLERLYTGTEWGEGPVWLPDAGALRWSDIPNNRIMQYYADDGRTVVYRTDVEFTNGRALDLDGAVVQCSHGRRAIEREADEGPVVLVDRWQGKRLNSPNDIVVASDGSIWFTDPPYGIISDREGRIADAEYGGCYVFRFDENRGELTPMVTDMVHPNGLAFSPDERILYVSDTGWVQDKSHPRHIRVYDVVDGRCVNGRLFAEIDEGWPDGFRVDTSGRVWSSSGDGVRVFAPGGELVLHVPVPERIGNLCFGGPDGHDLYIAATSSLYRIKTTVRNAPRP